MLNPRTPFRLRTSAPQPRDRVRGQPLRQYEQTNPSMQVFLDCIPPIHPTRHQLEYVLLWIQIHQPLARLQTVIQSPCTGSKAPKWFHRRLWMLLPIRTAIEHRQTYR
jgi:hypothetical protein